MIAQTNDVGSSISNTSGAGSGCGESSCCIFGDTGSRKPSHHFSSPSFVKNGASHSAHARAAVTPPALSDDALISKEMNELSFEEREQVFDDIHGVSDDIKETPELLENSLRILDRELDELPRTKRSSYDRAIFLKPSIETDAKFKLIFLRADDFDAFKAARRMAKYFEDKAKLWGEDKLVKKITLDDFDEEDMDLFQTGLYILPSQRDAVGRPVWLTNVPKFDFSKPKSQLRCCWYMIMTSVQEDEVAQIKGVCNIIYCPSSAKFNVPMHQFLRVMMDAGDVVPNLPVKTACSHFCYDSATMEFVLSAFRRAFGQKHRLRLRAHYGSSLEIQYKLMTYGIRFSFLFADDTENGGRDEKMEIHQQWTNERLKLEQELRQQQEQLYQETIDLDNRRKGKILMIPYPDTKDVLVGRGCPYQQFSGNVMLSNVIEKQFLKRYSQATDRFEKTCLHMDVVRAIQEVNGGRFVERTSEGWKVVDDKVARKKVNSSFRSKMAKYPTSSSKHDNNNSTATIEIGKKTKQPVSTVTMPLTTTPNNYHPYQNANNHNNNLFQIAFGGGAKRARYDPSVVY